MPDDVELSVAGRMSQEVDDATRRRTTHECLVALARASEPHERRVLIEKVVTVNLRIARAIARRYQGRGIPVEDLEQTAGLALVAACGAFDPARGHDFLTFAVPTIRGAVLKYFRDQGWVVRPPRSIRELQTRILRETAESSGSGFESEALARRLGESVEAINEALAARGCFQAESLDAPVGDGDARLVDRLCAAAESPFERVEERLSAAHALGQLGDRERHILYRRYFEECTQQALADELGVSQVQVSRELRRILDRIRALVADAA